MHVYKTVAGTEFQRVFPCHEVEIGLWPVLTRDDKEVQVSRIPSITFMPRFAAEVFQVKRGFHSFFPRRVRLRLLTPQPRSTSAARPRTA